MNFCVVEGQIRSKGSITRMCYAALGLYVSAGALCYVAKITPPDSHNGLVVALCGMCGGVVHKL